MNWSEAVAAMGQGHYVRRKSQMTRAYTYEGRSVAVFDCGTEGCHLAHAWTVDEKPVQVFRGADSRCLYVPDSDDRLAEDWLIVEKRQC